MICPNIFSDLLERRLELLSGDVGAEDGKLNEEMNTVCLSKRLG